MLKRTPLKRMSDKRRKEMAQYIVKRNQFIKAHPVCEACGMRPSTDLHHMKFRGPFFLDETTWLATCRFPCHHSFHNNLKLARELGYIGKTRQELGLA